MMIIIDRCWEKLDAIADEENTRRSVESRSQDEAFSLLKER
ncbi:MAG TPA: hypothetical protein V6C91_06945 [Coleofasciculaceae cyanobacterium]